MIDFYNFKHWLMTTTSYSPKTISNVVSRLKRADSILPWYNDEVYVFHLEQNKTFQSLSTSVRSQIKKAVKLFFEYNNDEKENCIENPTDKMKVLSLFSNIGVAEAYLESSGFHVAVANELLERRALLYSKIYPNTDMICGDITTKKTFESIISKSKTIGIDVLIATPPCQGMSTAGQQNEDDIRNTLICPVVDAIKELKPKYVFLENVPMLFKTYIIVNSKKTLIIDYIKNSLEHLYKINSYTIDTKNFSVPQTRERAIILMTLKQRGLKEWVLPNEDTEIVTMEKAIGKLPKLDPYITDVSEEELLRIFPNFYKRKKEALKISKWHNPPEHVKRQVAAMQHTPTGCTAFDNEEYKPVKENGELIKGYHNTYKRQNWNTPAYTVTMDNRKISSQNNVHPGRPDGTDENGNIIYSDARTLTLYEIMKIMSLPDDWNIPKDTSEAFLRRIIGEGIPPLFVKKVFENLK